MTLLVLMIFVMHKCLKKPCDISFETLDNYTEFADTFGFKWKEMQRLIGLIM